MQLGYEVCAVPTLVYKRTLGRLQYAKTQLVRRAGTAQVVRDVTREGVLRPRAGFGKDCHRWKPGMQHTLILYAKSTYHYSADRGSPVPFVGTTGLPVALQRVVAHRTGAKLYHYTFTLSHIEGRVSQ